MPRSPDPAIFVLTTDTTDHFTPCACARGTITLPPCACARGNYYGVNWIIAVTAMPLFLAMIPSVSQRENK